MTELGRILVIYSILWTVPEVQGEHAKQSYNTKCTFYIGCNYTLSVVPADNCHDDDKTISRPKRAVDSGGIHTTTSQTDILARLNRLQHKLTREMRHLSTRVLRGVRRLENDLMELTSKQRHGQPVDAGTGCPPGFLTLDNWPHCYLFSTFNTTWYEAIDYCGAMESHMVSVESLREHYAITFLIKNHPVYREAEGWWTGGTYVAKTKQWMWSSHNRPFTFTKWAVNEPNDLSQPSLQCVMMFRGDDNKWHDQLCNERYNFVCERSAKQKTL